MSSNGGIVYPHSLEAERAILGAVFIDNAVVKDVREWINDVDFYLEKHRKAYGRMVALLEVGTPVDPIIFLESFKRDGQLDEIGGAGYWSHLIDQVPTTVNAVHYAKIIREKARQRLAMQIALQAVETMGEGGDVSAVMTAAGKALMDLGEDVAPVSHRSVADQVRVSYMQACEEIDGTSTGWSTGLVAVDEAWDYLRAKKTYGVYARTKMGKSAFGSCLAGNLGRQGTPFVLWTGEMSAERYILRMAAAANKIDMRGLKRRRRPGGAQMTEDDVERGIDALYNAHEEIGRWGNALILDDRKMSPGKLEAIARRHFLKHGNGVVLVDYLQKMQPDKRAANRVLEISDISAGLLNLAHRLECAVVYFGQLNRGGFAREDQRPQQSDIREGDAPVFDADVFCFLHRPVYYTARKLGKRESECDGHRRAELIIDANRDGEMCVVPLSFFGEHGRFEDVGDQGGER